MFNCIIVEDEPFAIKVLEQHVKEFSDLKLLASCRNAAKAFEILGKANVDLMFLDIEMPKMDGLSFLKTLKNPPMVIITTAHRDFAMEGFELDVVDYLLKPISLEQMMRAISKLRRLKETKSHVPNEARYQLVQEPFIYVKSDRENVKIQLSDIQYVESLKNHIKIVTPGQNFITLVGISHMESRLPKGVFLRVHRSFLVNLNVILNYTNTYITIGRKAIPIGKIYKDEVLEILSKNQI
ncbi:MAG: LytTR family DNA-binding domain-containing protein [Bacteroidota bacterium]